jgi:hypothetical protein
MSYGANLPDIYGRHPFPFNLWLKSEPWSARPRWLGCSAPLLLMTNPSAAAARSRTAVQAVARWRNDELFKPADRAAGPPAIHEPETSAL